MAQYALINVAHRHDGLVDGSWIQSKTGSREYALEAARATEKANSNKIDVAVVANDYWMYGGPNYNHYKGLVEII